MYLWSTESGIFRDIYVLMVRGQQSLGILSVQTCDNL